MSKRIQLVGLRFGRLTVTAQLPSSPGQKKCRVLAVCDCGAERECAAADVRSGNTSSCGCLERELASARAKTHGHSRNGGTYNSWTNMRNRCLNKADKTYPHYGGRGIRICKEWDSYE